MATQESNNDAIDDEPPIDDHTDRPIGAESRRSVESKQSDAIVAIDATDVKPLMDSFDRLILEDKERTKELPKGVVCNSGQKCMYYDRQGLIDMVRHVFAHHRFDAAAKLMAELVVDQRIPHSIIVKAALIIFTNQSSSDSNALIQMAKKLMTLDVNKSEIMLEVLYHFIRIGDRNAAKLYIEANQSYLRSDQLRKDPTINTVLRCTIYFIDYLEWKESVDDKSGYDLASNRHLAEKTKLNLKNVITESQDMILDMFVLVLIEMYEYSHEYTEAVEVMTTYIRNDSTNMNAYQYLYNFGHKYPDYVSDQQMVDCMKNVIKYWPASDLVLDLVAKHVVPTEEEFELLLRYLDQMGNCNDLIGWRLLRDLLDSISDTTVELNIKEWFKRRYQRNWHRIHCRLRDLISLKDLDENRIEIYLCKQSVINYFYDKSHNCYEYYSKTNEMVAEYNASVSEV